MAKAAKRARGIPKNFEFRRGTDIIPCKCGGAAMSVTPTAAEQARYGCGREWHCCDAAFVCKRCKARYAGSYPAPEMD